MAAPVTTIPIVDRNTLVAKTSQIVGFIPVSAESPGTIIYAYRNTRRAATAFLSNVQTVINGVAYYIWQVKKEDLSFGGGIQNIEKGDSFYFQAKAVGKDKSDATVVYTVEGIDQPSTPYVQDDMSQPPRPVYERDSVIQGDVPLMNDTGTLVPVQYLADSIYAEGVAVSVYVDNAFVARVQSDRNGHWSLDLMTVDSPLLPLNKKQQITVRATRLSKLNSPPPGPAPSVESRPAKVLSGFYQTRLFDYYPENMKADDVQVGGDLRNFTQVLAVTMDEVKSLVDQFPDIFNIDRCDPKYFDSIATLLGYPLNRLDSIESQRFQIRNAVEFWRRKGIFEVFRIMFYMLDYQISIAEMWTKDYLTFSPTVRDLSGFFVYVDGSGNPVPPPDTSPYLLENGGEWYKAPYFALQITPTTIFDATPEYPYQTDGPNCPLETNTKAIALSEADLRYLLERIDYFRPAHTVLDYISFFFPILECGPIPQDILMWDVEYDPTDPGWYGAYCLPDDPIYYRDGLTSTRPDGKGTLTLGVTRDPSGLHPSTDPTINMKRLPARGYCHPGEYLEFETGATEEETYWFPMIRDGVDYPVGFPIGIVDITDWPSRDPLTAPPTRDGKSYRYASVLHLSTSP